MGIKRKILQLQSALLLAGSAFCIYSCGGGNDTEEDNFEGLMTQTQEDMVLIESENGKLSYRFRAPLMEAYEYDREPFREFRKGVMVETFSDSTNTVESTLVGDYAIQYLNRDLWEVKGNVVSTNAKGQTLETQQLFWNRRTQRIYSNVDSKLTQGNDIIIGVGFESDEQFVDWEFRRPRGTVEFDVESTRSGEDEGSAEDTDEAGREGDIPVATVETPAEETSASAEALEGAPRAREDLPARELPARLERQVPTEREALTSVRELNESLSVEAEEQALPALLENPGQ